MTIDKRALREVAEKATPGNWRRTSSLFNGITVTPFSLCGEEVMLAHTVEKRDAEFIAAANPTTMLALLDENLQLQREKDATEAVALALRDDMRQAREQLEAAEKRIADGSKRIAELEKGHQEAAKQINSWRRLAKQNIAERGKDISELEAARQRIAELEARVIVLPQRLSPEGYHIDEAYMVDDTEGEYLDRDAVIDAIRAAGIKVKGE
ncbi:ead/Ea22-like family protein [Salmonella enterica]|nr:ead/Ea22-like family protein [Salmonella enterica]